MAIINKFFHIIIGGIFILLGLFLWGNPVETLLMYSLYIGFSYILGVGAVLIFLIVHKVKPIPWANILVSFIIGFSILSLPILSLSFILWTFIISFVSTAICSFMKIYNNRNNYHVFQLVLSTIAIVYGVIMIMNPIVGANTIAKIITAFIFITGFHQTSNKHLINESRIDSIRLFCVN